MGHVPRRRGVRRHPLDVDATSYGSAVLAPPGAHPGRMNARVALVSVMLIGILAGCGSDADARVAGPNLYRDPAGWQILVPQGWRAVPFALHTWISSAEGAQISNVPSLPRPVAEYGMPLQTSGIAVPSSGISVVIATSKVPEQSSDHVFSPPLTRDDLIAGSCLAESPCLDVLWFRGNGHTFILSAKIGANAYGHQQAALARLIASVSFGG
jgi:hypothetical protein